MFEGGGGGVWGGGGGGDEKNPSERSYNSSLSARVQGSVSNDDRLHSLLGTMESPTKQGEKWRHAALHQGHHSEKRLAAWKRSKG